MGNFLASTVLTGGSLLRAAGGRFVQVIDTPGGGAETIPGTPTMNTAAHMGGYIHSMAGNVWRRNDGPGLASPPWTWTTLYTNSKTNLASTGFHPFLGASGPGLVAMVGGSGSDTSYNARFVKWLYNTPGSVQTIDVGVGTYDGRYSPCAAIVVGNLFYVSQSAGASSIQTIVYNLDTDAASLISGTNLTQSNIALVNNNLYRLTSSSNLAGGTPSLQVLLGGNWVNVLALPSLSPGINFFAGGIRHNHGLWEYNGLLYIAIVYNNHPGDGIELFTYNPGTATLTDITNTQLDPVLRPGGGLGGSSDANRWNLSPYWDFQDPFGTPRLYVQLATNDNANGGSSIILCEQTGSGLTVVGDSELNSRDHGMYHCPYYGNMLQWSDGNLWILQTALPSGVTGGVELQYLIGGDAGNADTNIRLYYRTPTGAPDTRATLSVPGAGLGQVGASLLEESPGIWVVQNWDANGVDTLTVVHETDTDSIASGSRVGWFASATKV